MTTTSCPAHPWGEATGLPCIRTDPHAVGHIYQSTSGVPDRHDQPGRGDSE